MPFLHRIDRVLRIKGVIDDTSQLFENQVIIFPSFSIVSRTLD